MVIDSVKSFLKVDKNAEKRHIQSRHCQGYYELILLFGQGRGLQNVAVENQIAICKFVYYLLKMCIIY